MQPYFFPYLGHFALIAAVDLWVVFDITQYTRKSWINRNRVLHPSGGWQYVSIPLSNSSIHIKIAEAQVADLQAQQQHVMGKLSHYRRRAPYYAQACEIVKRTFAESTDTSLVSLNVSGLRTICDYLKLPFQHRVCSQLDLDFPDDLSAGGWAPWIASRLSADLYVNPVSGRELFNADDFAREAVALRFLEFAPFIYETPGYAFEKDLSILDVVMWNEPDAIVGAIHQNSRILSATTDGHRSS
jgi:hypothetical protein